MHEKLAFGVVYNPPNKFNFNVLENAIKSLSCSYQHLIITGDFNVNLLKLPASKATRKLLDIFNTYNLHCPQTEPTNFVSKSCPSLIDLIALKNPSLLRRIVQIPLGSFTSHDLIAGSYNFPIDINDSLIIKNFRDFNAVNNESIIMEAMKLNWNFLYEIPDIDSQVEYLSSLLNYLIENYVPLRTISISQTGNGLSRQSSELNKLIDARNFYHKAYRSEKNTCLKANYHITFKKLRNKVTTMKRLLQRKLLQEFFVRAFL